MYHLYVETDCDFGLIYQGKLYARFGANIKMESADELDKVEITGPFGTPHTEETKDYEWLEAVRAIKLNPQYYDSIGGNRGVRWMTNKQYNEDNDLYYGLDIE